MYSTIIKIYEILRNHQSLIKLLNNNLEGFDSRINKLEKQIFSLKHELKIQKKFNNLTTSKFNEIIDFVNDLEQRIIVLEDKKNQQGKGQK